MTIPVFFDERQSVVHAHRISPSSGKPRLLVEQWRARHLDVTLAAVLPATRLELYRAHAPEYVDGVLDLRLSNGFGDRRRDLAASLCWTSGSLLTAARHVLAYGGHACSPTSGFHHACHGHGGGFCTFNGLMVTAMALQAEGRARRIGIIDIDQHYGNGTDDIIAVLGVDYVQHYTFGADRTCDSWNGGPPAERWLARLPELVRGFRDCDLVLYQAGGDPHVDDPLGGALTSAQMRSRDRIVFAQLQAVPLVWNLAGGYQEPVQKVLDLHHATLAECLLIDHRRAAGIPPAAG